MAWTNPHTWATSELVTAALLNTELRDNLNVVFAAIVPTGTVVPFASATVPSTTWLICDGSAVSRTTYAALFSAIGTTYGAGDGSTTFNVPDLRGRFPLGKDNMGGTSANRVVATQADNLGQSGGEENHTLLETELASHRHFTGQKFVTSGTSSPAISASIMDHSGNPTNASGANQYTDYDGGGLGHNTMPPYITLNYIIKT